MLSTAASFGTTLAKRLVDNPPPVRYELGPAAAVLFLGDFILYIPVAIFIAYSLGHVYPTLAAVEDPLPAYDALPLNDEVNDDGTPKNDNDASRHGVPITASLRATNRLVRSLGGWLSNLRGLGWSILIFFITIFLAGALNSLQFLPFGVAHLLVLLLIAPLSTTWTHLVVTPPSTKSFFSRIPRLRKVYLATWLPIILTWLAVTISVYVPALVANAIGLTVPGLLGDPNQPANTDGFRRPTAPSAAVVAKIAAVGALALALQVLLATPAHVALTRVQASLLPADEDTLVPFDRSFGGRVEPEVVTGKGFATFGAALATVSWRSWVRIYLLRLKVFLISVAVDALLGMVLAVQVLLVRRKVESK